HHIFSNGQLGLVQVVLLEKKHRFLKIGAAALLHTRLKHLEICKQQLATELSIRVKVQLKDKLDQIVVELGQPSVDQSVEHYRLDFAVSFKQCILKQGDSCIVHEVDN